MLKPISTLTRGTAVRKGLAAALLAAAALPAAAAADVPQIDPPKADAYLQPVFLKSGQGLVPGDQLSFAADTAGYTTQSNLYNPTFDSSGNPLTGPAAGPKEPVSCNGATYGKTIWTAFHSSRYGVVDVTASSQSFDEVIRVIPFGDPATDPAPDLPGTCFDDSSGFTESATGLVFPGEWFAVQIGGTAGKKTPAGGPLQVNVALAPPPVIGGNASLRWTRHPLRVSSLRVSGVPQGATVALACTKGACKSGKKPAARGSFTLRSNRKVRSGATISVRITAPGYVGKQLLWRVKGSSVSAAEAGCMNPGSSKVRAPGSCHG